MRITIFGDICPTSDTLDKFLGGDVEGLFNDLLPVMRGSDLVIGNLECALTDRPKPIQKAGPVLHAPTAAAATLRDAGFDVLSLANNHIRDCGDDGVMSTITACEASGIKIVGAGENLVAAKRSLVLDSAGTKVAIVSFAEHEFNFATDTRAGAATLDIYEDFDKLRELRKQVDVLIVLYHGGIEYHHYPSPLLAKKCRKMTDCGADVVLCQHSHCVGTVEKYNGKTIVYGQGNSLFGYRAGDDSWNCGIVVTLSIDNKNEVRIEYKMIKMHSDGLHLMDAQQSHEWEQILLGRQNQIKDEDFIDGQWLQFCKRNEAMNLPLLLGWPRIIIALNRRLKNCFVKLFYGKKRANITHNMLRCESHQEVMHTILHQKDFD